MNNLDKGRKVVEEMITEGWCDGCNGDKDKCWEEGKCLGDKENGKEKSV